MSATFWEHGWQLFGNDPNVAAWAERARDAALRAVDDPNLAHWHQCEGTWFVGVDALENDAQGRVVGSEPLEGAAVSFVRQHLGGWPALHKAQISVIYPGYPRPRKGESAGAFGYRQKRDAAHVDGVLACGPDRRRYVKEPHGFVLGLPLSVADARAAPMVVWEGSHKIMGAAFARAFAGFAPRDWSDVDVTEAYQAARREVFETCQRVKVHAAPGEAYLMHPLTLHGVAPWEGGAQAGPEGRMIAYFRPQVSDLGAWLNLANSA